MHGQIVSLGITKNQVQELLSYTKSDPQIRKFTHDAKRFKSLESFEKWVLGKYIYTLSDKNGKLLGVAWFAFKANPQAIEFPFTFAIRIYPPARGQGYSEKLMRAAFEKFMKSDKYLESQQKGFWLVTRRDNKFAIKLYEKFGFITKITTEDNHLLMTFSPS
ncbi:MAG: GNAT family N-acetyltransferase [Candidatus Woesebacteria bacterium]|nr:MAG: GNAT family N-acetyltransferase [Candidatus Woesebacteria bacterium]